MEQIGAGAEAVIYRDRDIAVKDRIEKKYRLKEIDAKLRKTRTRREAKMLEKLRQINFPGPHLIDFSDESMEIRMQFLDGKKLRDIMDKNPAGYGREIGAKLAIIHNAGIIHGDLTTSNMLLLDEIYIIDFGLSFFSDKIEDMAVDIHLFRQAIESKHHAHFDAIYNSFIDGYKSRKEDYAGVLSRLEKVEKRGRYAHKEKTAKTL